jgi:hypothetical protein
LKVLTILYLYSDDTVKKKNLKKATGEL